MIFRESETLELKEVVVDDIKKEIIAFANCDGGKLYIGVRDDGTVAGLNNPDKVSLQISNMVRDSIKPDVTMFLHYGNTFVSKAESITSSAAGTEKSLSDEEKVLEYTRSHGALTRNDVIELLGVSTSTASRVIRRMVKSNLLKQNGKARSTKYTIL